MEQKRFAARVAVAVGVCVAMHAQIGDLGIHPSASRLNQQGTAENATLFLNVRVFDGRNDTLSPPSSVLVKGNTIERVSTSPIDASTIGNTTVIDGQGRVLMPGLIDAHWHAFMAATPQTVLMTADASYLQLLAGRQAKATLMRGFTTVRDMGSPVFGLKRAIDEVRGGETVRIDDTYGSALRADRLLGHEPVAISQGYCASAGDPSRGERTGHC
jgi:imidazolonepropionase-like amidohydrolase